MKTKILIIPAGSGGAVSILKYYKTCNDIYTVGLDSDPLAPGLYLADKGYVIPTFNSPSFMHALTNILKKEKIDLVLPTIDNISIQFALSKKGIEKYSKLILSDLKTILITRDKWKVYTTLLDKIDMPQSNVSKDIRFDYPLLIKPRDGFGSRNVFKISNNKELDFFYEYVPNPIIQEYLNGKEYTIDCLVDTNGNLLYCIQRERIQAKCGISHKGKTVSIKLLEDMAFNICNILNIRGPFFFQAIKNDDDIPKLTEVNLRISGTMSLSNRYSKIYDNIINTYMGKEIISPIHHNIYVTRYLSDIYIEECDKNEMEDTIIQN